MEKIKVCIIFGGKSSEYAISLRSVTSVLQNINTEKYDISTLGIMKNGACFMYNGPVSDIINDEWTKSPSLRPCAISTTSGEGIRFLDDNSVYTPDCFYPVMHGENCEDGILQGALTLTGIPFVGSKTLASAVAMNKAFTNMMADKIGIKQANWYSFNAYDYKNSPEKIIANIEHEFLYPVFVKPASTGSSVGISKARTKEELIAAIDLASKYDETVLIEENIDGVEIEVAILGNRAPHASVCGEIIPHADFYDYDTKYVTDTAEFFIPARISDEVSEQIRDSAIKLYCHLGCRGLSRVDFILSSKSGIPHFNEINTLPGFTSISMYPKLFEASGIPYSTLIDKLITLSMEE